MTIFYSILFSLDEAKKNLYSYLPFFQYKALKMTGNLRPGDTYAVVCDEASARFLRRATSLADVKLLVSPTPRSLAEGMALKYIFPGLYDCSGQPVVYLDLDILPLGQLDFHVPDDSLLVVPEGAPTDSNYCGDQPLGLSVGLSAGFFAYRDGPRVRELFTRILAQLSSRKQPYYTLDQPFFNHEIAAVPGLAVGLPPTLVSFNGHNNRGVARLINLAGEPGDGPLHFQKVVEFFLSAFIPKD